MVHGEASFRWHPCIVVPFVSQMLLTRLRVYMFSQRVDSLSYPKPCGPGTFLSIRVARKQDYPTGRCWSWRETG